MRVRDLTPVEARKVAEWRYEGRYSTYDIDEPLGLDEGFYAVEGDDGELIGFACIGAEARVPGVDEEPGVVDVGAGMRPDLTGQGLGHAFARTIFDFVRERHPKERLRVVVYSWNARSRRVVERHGFQLVKQVGDFDVLVRD
jgi:RimJ/RimL family protein N-acetyltransferase